MSSAGRPVEETIKFELQHDRVGITMLLPDDVAEMSLAEAEKVHENFGKMIAKAKKYNPEAPAPMQLNGHDDEKAARILECGPRPKKNEFTPYFYIGGYEAEVGDLFKVRDWANAAIKYFGLKEKA